GILDDTVTGVQTCALPIFRGPSARARIFSAAVFNLSNGSCTGVIGADGGATLIDGGSNDGTGACAVVPAPPIGHGLPILLAVGGVRQSVMCGRRVSGCRCG